MPAATSGPGLLGPVALLAAGLAAGGIALTMPWLRRYALARPNARSSHRMPTPQGAGAAVVLAALLAGGFGLAVAGVPGSGDAWGEFAVVALAALGLAVLGGWDDLRPLGPLPRLGGQVFAVGAVAWAVLGEGARVFPALPLAAEVALASFAGVWLVNLTNFMDGLDGITVADLAPPALALVVLLGGGVPPGAPVAALVMAGLLGGLAGFAPFNAHPARVFLGDVGSLPLGLLIGYGLLKLAAAGHPVPALLLALYPLTDATVTLLRRLARGERVWEAHRTHAYQRATDAGWSARQVAGLAGGVNLALAALACALAVSGAVPWGGAALGTLGAGAVLVGGLLVVFARGPGR